MFINSFVSSFKSNKAIFILNAVSILVSLIIILTAVGLIRHYNKKAYMGELSTSGIYLTVNGQVTKSDLEGFIKKHEELDRLEYFYCEIQTSENELIPFYVEYDNNGFCFSKTIYKGYDDDMILQSGEYISDEQYYKGDNVALVSNICYSGDNTVKVLDKEYEIVGVLNATQGYRIIPDVFIPFTSLSDSQALSGVIMFKYNDVIDREFVSRFNSDAYECFGDTVEYMSSDEFMDFDSKQYYIYMMLAVILIAVLSCVDIMLVYSYILSKRCSMYKIMQLCGAVRSQLLRDFLFEINLFSLPIMIADLLLFEFMIKEHIIDIYEYAIDAYSHWTYIIIISVYIMICLLFSAFTFFKVIGNKDRLILGG